MGANLQVRPTLVVEHTADNRLITFSFKNADVKLMAAEDDFEIGAKKFRAGAIVVPNADRAPLEPMLKELGLRARRSSSCADRFCAARWPTSNAIMNWNDLDAGKGDAKAPTTTGRQ